MSLYHKRLQEAQERGFAQLNDYTFLVPSNSKDEDAENRSHMVTMDAQFGRLFCSCRSFRFRDGCDAVEQVRRILSERLPA